MAAETGIPSVYLEHQLSHGRAAKRTQGSLIDKLRHKTTHSHSWSDSIKSVCGAITERKMQTDSPQPENVRGCLDTLQKAMKVISQQTLKERLDMIARQLGLSTQVQNMKISLGTDVFHVDIILGESGLVSTVKLINQGDIVESPDLKDVLRRGDFKEFIEHLQGLQSIYQVTNDEKLKSKAFLALQALEKDLNQLAQFQNSISGVANYIHKCPLGIMLPRLAGKPMKLIYFVSPYDLLDKKTLTAHPLTVEAITENFLGQSVTVCIEPVPESQPANKLQTMPLMNVSKTQDGKTLPSFSAVSSINSMMLPASFVLVLPQSIPISTQILQKITASTQLEIHKEAPKKGLRTLILQSFSNGKVKDSRKLHVSLPDQHHIYFLDGLNGGTSDQQGVMVSRIPFTHPTHVPQILNLMRQQLLFNIIISSFIRTGTHQESEKSVVFEVTAVTLQQITIVFEHPVYDSMITVDIDLSDITNLKCSVTCTNSDENLCSDEEISRVFQRCMSIPIMLRWLICKGRGQLDKMKEDALAAERQEKALFLKEMLQRQAMIQPSILPTRGRPPPQPPHPPPLPPPPSYSHLHQASTYLSQGHANGNTDMNMGPVSLSDMRGATLGLEDFGNTSESNGPHVTDGSSLQLDSEQAHAPLLSNLLDVKAGKKNTAELHDAPILSCLLDDNTSVATTVTPMTTKPTPRGQNKRERKRRLQGDTIGPNPKHRFTDNDRINSPSDRLASIGSSLELDMVPNLMDQGLPSSPSIIGPISSIQGTPTHQHHLQQQHSLPNHSNKASRSQGNVIDLTEDVGESNLKKLADSVEHLMHNKDVKSEPDLSVLLNEAEAPSRISNILQNSPSGSKNEHASTSLEGFLKGSGEVGRAKDFDPSDAAGTPNSTTFSKLSSLLLASTDSPSSVLSAPPHKANAHFFNDKAFSSGGIANTLLMQDVKQNIHKGQLRQSSSMDLSSEMQPCMTGIFEKFDMSRNQQNCKVEMSNSNLKNQLSEGKVSLKLKVGPLKQQNNVKQVTKLTSPVSESKEIFRKVNNIGTFDFKSDEDDDDSLAFHDRSLYSTSPTIPNSSSKQRHMSDSLVPKKTEKVKKKDKGSGNATKRKRDKEESKREKKRKKNEHHIQDLIYRTVENDGKADIKLKIKVIPDKGDSYSDGNVQSYEISKKQSPAPAEKEISSFKSDSKEVAPNVNVNDFVKDKDILKSGLHASKTALSAKSVSLKGPSKSGSLKTIQGGNLSNKTDPKLSTKATIRLKPLTMPNPGSTVNVSQSGSKASVVSSLISKSDRRTSSTSTASSTSEKRLSSGGSSLERKSSSNLIDRRNSSQFSSVSTSSAMLHSSSSTPTTTVTTSLTLSSILPNAPTTSRIASLPRIPKLSSSSSNTSLNRTSSLDPVSSASPTPAGTKSNNSYNTGPAGRANMPLGGPGVNNAGVGVGSRLPGHTNTSYSYNRGTGPGVGVGGNVRAGYNMARIAGQGHRQGSPVGNSGPASLNKPPGIKPHNPSGSFVPGTNTSKQVGSVHTNYNIKGSSNHGSQNIAQRTFGNSSKKAGAVTNMAKSNVIPKSILVGSPNNLSSHRHTNQNTHSNSNVRTPLSSSSNISRSPNASAVTKSPSSGKSPNISSNAGRSPSLTSSSRSPSINNPSRSPNINKSPNINSSSSSKSPSTNVNSSKSPNANLSKSPSATNNASRNSSNPTPTSKPVSHPASKFPPNSSKAANVNKCSGDSDVAKSLPIYVPQKAMSCSLKPSQVKSSSPKVVSALSSVTVSQQVSSKVANVTVSPSPSPTNKTSNAVIPVNAHLTGVSSEPVHKLNPPQLSSSTSSTTVDIQKSSMPLGSCKPPQQTFTQSSIGSSVQMSASDTLNGVLCASSSTPTTPKSAEGAKKFCFPASRGRKSSCSLSAIVDKLKNNAVGAGLDSTQSVASRGDNTSSRTLCVEDKVKSTSADLSRENSCGTDISKDSRVSSPKHLDNVTKSPVINNVVLSKPKSPVTKSPLVSMPNSCEAKSDSQCEVSQTVLKTADDAIKIAESPVSTSLQNVQGSPTSSQQCSVPDPPFVLPFQHQPPLSTSQNTSRTSSIQSGPTKGLSNKDQQLFKVPTVKPVSEQPEDEGNKASECASVGSSNKPTRVEIEGAKSGENIEIKSASERRTSGGEKKAIGHVRPLASPLSDISSPENGLIIDDEESPQRVSRTSFDANINVKATAVDLSTNSAKHLTADVSSTPPKLSGLQVPQLESSSSDVQISKESGGSPHNSSDSSTPQASPKPTKSVSAKSPALSKAMSGASTPKGSDSPCEIDDDLMDEALGFGS